MNYSELSENKKQLLRQMQTLNFGRIKRLTITNGEPLWTPVPIVEQEIRLTGLEKPRVEHAKRNYPLKDEVVRMFDMFSKIGTAVILCLEVRHGLPYNMIVDRAAA